MANIVSERYALSLYEVAKDENQVEKFFDELGAVAEIFAAEPAFLKVLTTPSIAFEEKMNILKNVFNERIEPYMLNFLLLATEKGRIGLIGEMRQAYQELYYQENGIIEVTAITAVPLNQTLEDKLREKMNVVTGKKVVLKKRVDAGLLGGIVLKVDNKQFDTSLKTRLSEIAQQMTKTIA